MTHFNQVRIFHLEFLSTNATVNFGQAIHKGYSGNVEQVGGQLAVGNTVYGPRTAAQSNLVYDKDVVDQPQRQT